MRLRICGKLLDGGKGRHRPETLMLIECGHITERKIVREEILGKTLGEEGLQETYNQKKK